MDYQKERSTGHRLRGLRGQGVPEPELLHEVTVNKFLFESHRAPVKDKNSHTER